MLNYSKLLFLFLSLAIFGLGGCSTTSVKKELTFNALILDNKSGLTLEHVRIEARANESFCNLVELSLAVRHARLPLE